MEEAPPVEKPKKKKFKAFNSIIVPDRFTAKGRQTIVAKPKKDQPLLPDPQEERGALAQIIEQSSFELEEEAKQLLSKKARTDEDLDEENFDMDKQLGGLNEIDVMNSLIKELSEQNENFTITLGENRHVEFPFSYHDVIFTLKEPNQAYMP